MNVYSPEEAISDDLRTGQNYTYTIEICLNLTNWSGDVMVSDQGTPTFGVHLTLCELGRTGFCSPFVHSNEVARLRNEGKTDEDPEYGDRHADSHVDSIFSFAQQVAPTQRINVTVPIQVNRPGSFSVVAGVIFFLSDSQQPQLFPTPLYQADVANIPFDARIVQFRDAPEILEISNSTACFSYVMVAMTCIFLALLMHQVFVNRMNQVLMLTQGKFLLAMLAAGFVASLFSFTFLPSRDLLCNLVGPTIVLPLHIFWAVILGRMWRIHATLSPLLLLTLEKEKTWLRKVVESLHAVTRCSGKKHLRRTVTDRQLAFVILIFTLPQLFVQVLRWVMEPNESTIIFNEEETIGSVVCLHNFFNSWFEGVSIILLVCMLMCCLFLAKQSTSLPSLFNEGEAIFDVTLVALIVLAVIAVVAIMTDAPTTSPNVRYLVCQQGTLAIVAYTAIKLIIPKLVKVWRGDRVVVTQLIADHNQRRRDQKSGEQIVVPHWAPHLTAQETYSRDPESAGDDDSTDSSVVIVEEDVLPMEEYTNRSTQHHPPGSIGIPEAILEGDEEEGGSGFAKPEQRGSVDSLSIGDLVESHEEPGSLYRAQGVRH